ncbi:MAG: SMI1/KNR4 family protein [Caulobacter sp.]|nr:SMI1/KNR4 family protein [Caulobacter sp.]
MTVLANLDLSVFWDPSEFATSEYVDELLTDELLARVEAELGYRLPAAYVALCQNQNGGAPIRTCHRAATTSWAPDHVAITNIKAIGFKNIWSLCGELGRDNTLTEWGYPAIGVYFADCPSAGHDMLCLDYRQLDDSGEPAVVHVSQGSDYTITFVAPSFESFLLGLEPDEAFDDDGLSHSD